MCVVSVYKVGWVFLSECSCGLVSRYSHANRQVAAFMAVQHVENRERPEVRQGVWLDDVALAQQIDANHMKGEKPRLALIVESSESIKVQTRNGEIHHTLISLAKGG